MFNVVSGSTLLRSNTSYYENGNAFPKWVTQKIKELGNVYTGNTPSKKQSTYWNSNNYIWVTPTDINNKKE